MPVGTDARPDRLEVFDHLWISPHEAIGLAEREEIKLMTPTLRNLELLGVFAISAPRVNGHSIPTDFISISAGTGTMPADS